MNNKFESVVLAINYFIMKTTKEGHLPSARKLDKEKTLNLSVGWASVAKFLKEHLYIYSNNNRGFCWNTSKKTHLEKRSYNFNHNKKANLYIYSSDNFKFEIDCKHFADVTFDQNIDASPVDLAQDFAKILAFVYCSEHSVKVTKLLKLETIDGDIWCNSYIYKGAQDNIHNPIIKLSFTNHDSNMIFGY